eukprot:PITA_12561
MRGEVPSCFSGESKGNSSENLVSSTYETKCGGRGHTVTSVTWDKNVMVRALCIAIGEPPANRCVWPEPERGYYIAVVCNEKMALLLGDMEEEAYINTKSRSFLDAVLVSREEHVLGKESFATMARFGDGKRSHEVLIDCQTERTGDPALVISVDREVAVEVKHLLWKFRGNGTIYVGGVPFQILWDVHDWLFNPGVGHHALFIFKSMTQQSRFLQISVS